jgi:hypothetical protein
MSRYYSGPISDHFNGERFFDPNGAPPRATTDSDDHYVYAVAL